MFLPDTDVTVNVCLQALMQAAIYASTPTLAAALRQVLAGLHAQKKTAGVDSMLCRLYEPILFRSFSATNADVRRNALLLFLDAFPVRVSYKQLTDAAFRMSEMCPYLLFRMLMRLPRRLMNC